MGNRANLWSRHSAPVAADIERTLVDVLDRPSLTGSWEEIWRSLESIEYVDAEAVIKYALLLGSAAAAAKVGYFLERHRKGYAIDDAILDRVRAHRPASPYYIDQPKRRPGRFIAGWNLVVPSEVEDRTWEEPDPQGEESYSNALRGRMAGRWRTWAPAYAKRSRHHHS